MVKDGLQYGTPNCDDHDGTDFRLVNDTFKRDTMALAMGRRHPTHIGQPWVKSNSEELRNELTMF